MCIRDRYYALFVEQAVEAVCLQQLACQLGVDICGVEAGLKYQRLPVHVPDAGETVNFHAAALELESSSVKIYRFSRIRNVNGQPLILETSFYPTYIYPKLTRELLETHSFYSLLYEEGIVPVSYTHL